MMKSQPWYLRYDEIREEVQVQKEIFEASCSELGISSLHVLREFWKEIIARAVRESNWQEGLYLNEFQTRELVDIVYNEPISISGTHININSIVDFVRKKIISMKKNSKPIEEIATYNLSMAHRSLEWIHSELTTRQFASLMYSFNKLSDAVMKDVNFVNNDKYNEMVQLIEKIDGITNPLLNDNSRVSAPLTKKTTFGELLKELKDVDIYELINPFKVDYLHFFHKVTMMGIMPVKKCGVFRQDFAHVQDYNVQFALPSMIPSMVDKFCKEFPSTLASSISKSYDPILVAAEQSYKFVIIHPYADGNGRVSRLIMNLILWNNFPPANIKADPKGRNKYGYALRRANTRGDIKPLAYLIAISIKETYERMLKMLDPLKKR